MSTKHRKTRQFLAGKGVGGRGRGPSLLRRGEKRLRQGHGQGAPGRIFGGRGCRRQGRRPLSPTERRELPYGNATARAPGRIILRADAPRRLRRISRSSISSQCGLESFWMGTCFRNIFLMFFEKSSWNRNFVGNRRLFWGASEFPKAPAKVFSRRTAANFNLLLRVKTPLCKDFSV